MLCWLLGQGLRNLGPENLETSPRRFNRRSPMYDGEGQNAVVYKITIGRLLHGEYF
jgi:hypothetical protein